MVLLSMLPIGSDAGMGLGRVLAPGTRARLNSCRRRSLTRLRWMRMIGDTLFAFGALVLGWFVLGLVTGHSFDRTANARRGRILAEISRDSRFG